MSEDEIINELQKKYETDKESLDIQQLRLLYECEKEAAESIFEDYQEIGKEYFKLNEKIKEIRDKAEVMDYYTLNDVIDDLTKLIGDGKDE
jgi:predicted transcriptional regulator